jgi:hypothetical protein
VIHNFRSFDYVSKTDFRSRWETKTVHLSNLRTVDFFTNYRESTPTIPLYSLSISLI